MSGLLGLNYYDDEDDEQQSDNDGVTEEQHITVTAISFDNSGEDQGEVRKNLETKNVVWFPESMRMSWALDPVG
ncbi:10951_t:CDS:2 [Acaulospora colombiana]|uniref:10951_t:CDS:1 n=1 Tax=Acaulospora colombiana TaxID=27376 RepID=A0ACA9JX39_9GLOM|nr:10951_t:CDS:2 [Acaulospora colombiana]